MDTEAHNQESTTQTILDKTSSESEPDKHGETVLKHYEAKNVKDHIEDDNIEKLTSVDELSSEKLLASSSQLNTPVEICDNTEVSESLDGKETEDQVSKSLGVKETEGELSKNSDEIKIEDHHVEKGELNSPQEIQLITKEAVGEGHGEHNLGTDQEAEVYESARKEENKVENLSNASITLDGTEKITNIEPVTVEDHTNRTSPEEDSRHKISSGMTEKDLDIASASEDAPSNLEETECRGDMKEEITNTDKIGCETPVDVTLQSDYLKESNKEAEAVESSSGIMDIASLDGQREILEKARSTEINLPESPREASKDETIDASSTTEKPAFDEKNVLAADFNEEDEIHLYGKDPPVVQETDASEGTQLSVEEPQVMRDIDEADKKLDSSNLGLPLTEGASGMDLAPPCEIEADNLETKSNMDSKKELAINETSTEDEDQNADSLVESHNIIIASDANRKVTNQETDFDSSSTTHSDKKREELNVQESEHSKDLQMDGKPEATGLRDEKESNMNDETKQDSKSEEHGETDTLNNEAEEIYSDIADKEHTTQSYSATLTTEESNVCQENETQVLHKITSIAEPDEHPESMLKLYEGENGNASNTESSDNANIDELSSVGKTPSEKLLISSSEVNKTTETDNGTEQISESLEGKEIQGELLEGSEGNASEGSEGKETESWDRKSIDGKETQDHHVEKGECISTQEIQTNTEEISGERHIGPNGGIAPDGDIEILAANSHQNEEVEVSELTCENDVENVTKAIKLDNTEMTTGVEPVTFEDHLYKPSVEENSSQPITSSMVKNEIYVPSSSEDPLANLEDIELRAMEEETINHEKIGHSDPVNVTLESDHVSHTNKEDMEKGEEIFSHLERALNVVPIEERCFTSSSETDVTSFGVKGNALLHEQSETEEKTGNTEIYLPEVPAEAREDENIDASSEQENQPFDEKNISADDPKEEDETNQHDQTKGQPDAPPLVREIEVCEENPVSAKEPHETHDLDEADIMPDSSNLGASNNMIHHSQINADSAETKIAPTKESQIIAESNTKDNLQENDDAERDSIKAEINSDSGSTIPTAKITDELNTQESEYEEDSHMEEKSIAKGELGDGKESDTNNAINQNSELQGHGETDTFEEDEKIPNITDKEQCSEIYPTTLTTEEFKKTNEEAAREYENPEFNSPNKEEGAEDEPPASIREKDLLDSPATLEEVIKASIEEDKENGSQIKEEHCDQAIGSIKRPEDETKIEDLYVEDMKRKEENVVVSQVCTADTSDEAETNEVDRLNSLMPTSIVEKVEENQETIQANVDSTKPEEIVILEKESKEQNLDATHHVDDTKSEAFISESSQVPEEIENNDHIIQTAEETNEDGTVKELHSVSEPDIPSHDVKDINLESLQSINITDSNDKAEERPVQPAENPKTEEEPSVTEAPEEMKEGKEQIQDMKSVSSQNIEKKDSDEKPEESIIQLAENSNTEQESSTSEVAQETTEDKEIVQHISSISLQNIDTVNLDEKSEERILELAENSNPEQETSATEVAKETTEDKENIQDMTNITFENLQENASHNFITEADDCNDKADVLVEKESPLKDVHIDEKTFQVNSTDMDDENPSRINISSQNDEQVEIRHSDQTSGSVYQTEPSETKETISERIMREKPNLNDSSTEMESKYSIDALSESIETPNGQENNADKSQQHCQGIEETHGMIHGDNDDVEVGHITSIKKKEEASNELQETCVVQPMEEQEHETLDSIAETMDEDGVAVGVSSMTSSLLNNDSNTLESTQSSVEGMYDQSTMEEKNIHKEKSEETREEMSSPDHNCLTSENSMKDVDHGNVMIEELQESKEATDLKDAIKEESLHAEIGAENIPKEETTETGSTEENISRVKINKDDSDDLERNSTPEEPQRITIEEMSETTKQEETHEKVPDIIQIEKDIRDDEYEKSLESNSQGGERSIADDFEVTIPGSNRVCETTESLVEGHTPAEGFPVGKSEEIKRSIIYEDINEKNEDHVTYEANTNDVKVNEISMTNVLRDIEMMPKSHTTAQTETQKQKPSDDSNDVPEATNSNPELKCTSEESKAIEQEGTTIRSVDDTTLDLTQEPTDNNLSAPDKGESIALVSEVHDDHVITDEAEKEDTVEHEKSNNIKMEIENSGNLTVSSDKGIEERDPRESKPMISSIDKDIPLLESVSTTVTDIEEVKQVYPHEAVPDPKSTECAENEGSHDLEEAAGSPERTSELGHRFAEENIFEPRDSNSQEHDKHILQHVQESSMDSQKGSIKDVESTDQTPVSEALNMSEKDAAGHTIDTSIMEEMKYETSRATPDDMILVQGGPENHIEKTMYSEDKEINIDKDEAVKQEQEDPRKGNPGAEIPLTGEKDPDYYTSKEITMKGMEDESPSMEPDNRTLVHQGPGDCTNTMIFSGDKEVKADGAEVDTGDRDVQKEETLDSEDAVVGKKDSEDNKVSVEENIQDLKETVSHTDDKGVNPDSKSGVTDVKIEKLIPVNSSEAVAESESLESAEDKISSHAYQERQKPLESTLSSKAPQTNQGQDSAGETKLNGGEIDSSTTESLHATPHITGLSTATIMKPGDSDTDITMKNQEKQEKHMEADQKGTEEPVNAKSILQLQQKEDADILQPSNSNKDKTPNETKEGNNVPSEKDEREEDISVRRSPEAKKEETHAKNTGRAEDEEGKEHHDENSGPDLRVGTEAPRDADVKVSPKKSHNLFSGVIKHSISKMKKAITCTNAQPMPQSPR